MTSRLVKFGLALAVLAALISNPAMRCVSAFYQMDMQEMACCANMSGNCDMGAGHSSCCQTVSDPSFASSTVPTKPVSIQVPGVVSPFPASTGIQSPVTESPLIAFDDSKPPGVPPGSETVLRI